MNSIAKRLIKVVGRSPSGLAARESGRFNLCNQTLQIQNSASEIVGIFRCRIGEFHKHTGERFDRDGHGENEKLQRLALIFSLNGASPNIRRIAEAMKYGMDRMAKAAIL
jgi:hypothetical protein